MIVIATLGHDDSAFASGAVAAAQATICSRRQLRGVIGVLLSVSSSR